MRSDLQACVIAGVVGADNTSNSIWWSERCSSDVDRCWTWHSKLRYVLFSLCLWPSVSRIWLLRINTTVT